MSLEWLDSFDARTPDSQKYAQASDGSFLAGRTGLGHNGSLKKYFAAKQTRYIGFSIKFVGQSGYFLSFYDNLAPEHQIIIGWSSSNQKITITRGGGTLLATSTGTLTVGQTYHMQVKCKVDNSAGEVVVKVNGVTFVSYSGDTQFTANATSDTILLDSNLNDAVIDDLWVCNEDGADYNTYLGDLKVVNIVPTGAGTTTNMTPSAGANWQCVDEIPPNDTDYVSSSTPGNIDTYAMSNPALAGSVRGVQLNVVARKDDAGVRTVRPICRSGTTNYPGSDVTMNTTYQTCAKVMEVDPDTGADWSLAGVNAVEGGQEVTA